MLYFIVIIMMIDLMLYFYEFMIMYGLIKVVWGEVEMLGFKVK